MSPSSTAIVISATVRGRRRPRPPRAFARAPGPGGVPTASVPVFRVPLAEVEAVAWPWWWFGSRLVITVRGERYRIAFGPADRELGSDTYPGTTADSDADLLVAIGIGLLQILVSFAGRSAERAAVRQLRELLRPTPVGPWSVAT